jgi:hypothetical protein
MPTIRCDNCKGEFWWYNYSRSLCVNCEVKK